jgi:hypothetical protein
VRASEPERGRSHNAKTNVASRSQRMAVDFGKNLKEAHDEKMDRDARASIR